MLLSQVLIVLLIGSVALIRGQDELEKPTAVEPTKSSNVDSTCTRKCDPFSEICVDNECKCNTECPVMEGDFVCTNGGKEYVSRCEFYRDQCLCKKDQPQCTSKGVENEYILFYGPCANRQLRQANTDVCNDYHNRLAKWLEMMFAVRESQRYNVGTDKDAYALRLYQQEFKMYSALDSNEQSMSRSVVTHGQDTEVFDPKLITFWFCSLDRDGDGKLVEAEQGQLTRILMPACPCIDNFLTSCRGEDRIITIHEFVGETCFKIVKASQITACETLRLNPFA